MTNQEEIAKLENECSQELSKLVNMGYINLNISMDWDAVRNMLSAHFEEGYIKILKERLVLFKTFQDRSKFKSIEESEAKGY